MLDACFYYISKYGLTIGEIESEKEAHAKFGFGSRCHQPDLTVMLYGMKHAVEIELTPKSKERTGKNIKDNYMNYDAQVWFTNNTKVMAMLKSFVSVYPHMEIKELVKGA